ncbi:MAG TPA: hypothetical protein VFU58_07270 [Candidatus Nitrosotalea sp.]|nr:hypothetical protein [Candidatus Nitrosotalea sp.]
MKTLGAVLIVLGVVISVIGYGMYANIGCECPAQIVGKPFDCHCEENLEQNIGHMITYFGFTVTGTGIILFVLGWRRQKSLVGVEK